MAFNQFVLEFVVFGIKQAKACIFGGFLLVTMLVTHFYYPIEVLHRYDFIFLASIGFQIFLLIAKLESVRESLVIITFHLVATVMELFKTSDSIGAWVYPEEYFFGIANVPLFTSFMYSAVGSYLTRVWRIFDFQYINYPNKYHSFLLVLLVYINFFSHHYVWDIRWILLMMTVVLFIRTQIYFKVMEHYRSMPLLVGWFLVALFIWFAENVATYANIWIYPNQEQGVGACIND